MSNLIIIEDNEVFTNALVDIIASIPGITLQNSFTDAETAIKELAALEPDIVIVDIQLTGKLSGVDLIRLMKPRLQNTAFLVCSAHDDNLFIFDALRSGAAGYILKDSSLEQIKTAIIELKNGGAPMSPFIARQVIQSFRQKSSSLDETGELTSREKEVLQLLAKGMLYKEIAGSLGITHATVKKHIGNIYEKLHVQNKVEALNKYKLL